MEKNEIIDTHCHLYLEEFSADLPQIIDRAAAEGVSTMYMPALDSQHHDGMLQLESRFPGKCLAMIGLHPCYVKENYREELEIIDKMLEKRKFAAIGEIGLDYYWDRSYDEYQAAAFSGQIAMARRYHLPIVIHSRSSMEDSIRVLQAEAQGLRGIFHCFSGTAENARDIIDCGLMLGIGGVVTYKNAGLAEVVAGIPLEHLVLETDAPYLTPVPYRGRRNESSYLKYILGRIAAVKGISEAEVAAITTANAKRVFG